MARDCPQIHLTFRELSHSDLIRALLAGDLDAAINSGEALPQEDTRLSVRVLIPRTQATSISRLGT